MPQLPNSSTDDYGADDEVKEYKQEDGEENENAPVDLVNDIKSDLIKRETENSEQAPKPAADASSAPIAQLLSFPDRYNEHLNSNSRSKYHPSADGMHKHPMLGGHGPTSGIFNPHQGYSTGQYQYPMYSGVKPERYHYDAPMWPPRGAVMGQPPSQYSPNYPPPVTPTSAAIPRLSHPNMTADPRTPLHCAPPPPPNQTVMSRGPTVCMGGSSMPSQTVHMNSMPGMENAVSGRDGQKAKLSHVKKPLNAFMLYMKDMRSKVVSECTLKESAAINQILGKRWHALDRGEQAKYYEMARKERQLHMQLYPGWSARDNYAQQGKKKKRKRDKSQEITNPKKCRARYGLDRQHEWCKPCRRKKKCIRFLAGNGGSDSGGASGLAGSEIENIDTNTSGNMSTVSTGSPGSPS